MAPLAEGQFEIGGVVLGGKAYGNYAIGEFTAEAFEVRSAITPNAVQDGSILGRDRYGSSSWSFTIHVIAPTQQEATGAAYALATAWRPPEARIPGARVPLRYCFNGDQKVVYGRPGKISQPRPDLYAAQGYIPMVCDFTVTDPACYDVSSAGRVSLSLLAPTSEGGVIWYEDGADNPFWWDGASQSKRAGMITNTGLIPSPLTIDITGPVQDPWVAGPGWRTAFHGLSVPYDRTVRVDTAAASCVWTDTGASASRYLGRESSLVARLAPGDQEIQIGGVDPTGTAKFVFSWLPATPIL